MTEPFTFGMFPFRRPDDFGRIGRLLRLLQGEGPRLPARAYVGWAGARTTKAALDQIAHLAGTGLRWDLVLAYRDPHADIAGWTGFAAQAVTGYGADLAAIQITGEANVTGVPTRATAPTPVPSRRSSTACSPPRPPSHRGRPQSIRPRDGRTAPARNLRPGHRLPRGRPAEAVFAALTHAGAAPGIRIDAATVPQADVERIWTGTGGGPEIVLVP